MAGLETTFVQAPSVSPRPRPLERVEAEIVALATQLSAATARLLALVGEFDAAQGWRAWAMRSTAHWLSWQCGVGLAAGREQVRVARALRDLPVVAAAFTAGRLSYAKVRAVTRVATAANEADLVMLAEHATAADVERVISASRRVQRTEEVRRRRAARYLRHRVDDDGCLVGSFRLTPEDGAVLIRALEVARGRAPDPVGETDPAPADQLPGGVGAAQTGADALVALAHALLDTAAAAAPAGRGERYCLALHATVEQLARPDDADDTAPDGPTVADGTRLHPATARRLTCDCPGYTLLDGIDGAAVHVGRRSRRIPTRTRRAVHARDRGRCRAPGCTEPAAVIHHLRHWANGGTSCLRNLISLCEAHHWLVHDGGWTLTARHPGEWVLLGPTGVTVTPTPDPTPDPGPLPDDPDLDPAAVAGHWAGERLDLPAAVDLVLRPHDRNVSAETPARPATGAAGPAATADRNVSAETPAPRAARDDRNVSAETPMTDPDYQFPPDVIARWCTRLDEDNERAIRYLPTGITCNAWTFVPMT